MVWSLRSKGRALVPLAALLALAEPAAGAGFDEKYRAAVELKNQGKNAEAAGAMEEAFAAARRGTGEGRGARAVQRG